MNEEIYKVLEMVKIGRITPAEGEKLISALKPGEDQKQQNAKKTMLRVRVNVNDPDNEEKAKVNVNVPLSLAKKAMGLVSLMPKDVKKELNENGIDLDAINLKELIEMFEDGEISEELVNVETGTAEKGATVRVYVD